MPSPVRANQTVRSWIPHPTTHIGVVENIPDLWENRPEKVTNLDIFDNIYSQAVTIKSFLRYGRILYFVNKIKPLFIPDSACPQFAQWLFILPSLCLR